MAPLQYFRQFAPEFNNLADETVTAWLSSASVFVTAPDPVTEKSKLAQALYAAHLCWMNRYQRGAVRGPLSSESHGESRKGYRQIVGSNDWLGQSPYGLQYKGLMGGVRVPAIFTRFGDSV